MNLDEALQILRDSHYLVESNFPLSNRYGREIFGQNVRKNMFHALDRQANAKVKDTGDYDDDDGVLWCMVKKKDWKTLALAVLDGMFDYKTFYKNYDEQEYIDKPIVDEELPFMNITEEDFTKLYSKYKPQVDKIINYLKKYMHGRFTVYRGISMDNETFLKCRKYRKKIAKFFTNKNKYFNSFSTDINGTYDYAYPLFGMPGNIPVIIAGEATPNDVYFAFSAYLMGRHINRTSGELNISNINELENLRVVKIGKEIA